MPVLTIRDWERMEWRWDHIRGWGKLECKVQLSMTTRECLQLKSCWAALLPKLVTWLNWCWAKAWAVGDQGAWEGMVGDQLRV